MRVNGDHRIGIFAKKVRTKTYKKNDQMICRISNLEKNFSSTTVTARKTTPSTSASNASAKIKTRKERKAEEELMAVRRRSLLAQRRKHQLARMAMLQRLNRLRENESTKIDFYINCITNRRILNLSKEKSQEILQINTTANFSLHF